MLTLPSLNRFMIQTWNEHITARLRRRRNDVHVFCVSNELYSGYRLNESVHAQDYLELSGIPQLRRYCQLVPAEAHFHFIAMFLEHRLEAKETDDTTRRDGKGDGTLCIEAARDEAREMKGR